MKELTRRLGALALALGLGLTLAACGESSGLSKREAETYVDGLLRETYLGEFDADYLRMVDLSEEEARKTYGSGLDAETEFFMGLYNIEYPTEELRQEVRAMYAEIYAHARFEVVSAAEQDDGSFSVKVNVEPIDIVRLVDADWAETVQPFYDEYPYEVQSAMEEEAYRAMDAQWARLVVDLYQEKLPETVNLAAQPVTVQLERDRDGNYAITSEDLGRLDEAVIDYSVYANGVKEQAR